MPDLLIPDVAIPAVVIDFDYAPPAPLRRIDHMWSAKTRCSVWTFVFTDGSEFTTSDQRKAQWMTQCMFPMGAPKNREIG